MLIDIFDEIGWYVPSRQHAMYQVGMRHDLQGLPRKEGVCLYIQRPDNRGRPQGLVRLDLTPVEAHKLAQALELEARALAGKFSSSDKETDA